jgi:hypothetical protein
VTLFAHSQQRKANHEPQDKFAELSSIISSSVHLAVSSHASNPFTISPHPSFPLLILRPYLATSAHRNIGIRLPLPRSLELVNPHWALPVFISPSGRRHHFRRHCQPSLHLASKIFRPTWFRASPTIDAFRNISEWNGDRGPVSCPCRSGSWLLSIDPTVQLIVCIARRFHSIAVESETHQPTILEENVSGRLFLFLGGLPSF